MKKKIVAGLTTGFFILIICGTANSNLIPPQPPIADANGPYYVIWGNDFIVDGSGSWDQDNDIVLYEWDTDQDGQYDPDPELVATDFYV